MSAAPPLRIGVVGCGYQGTLLAQAVARTKTLRVTACVDPDLRVAAELADRSRHEHSFGSLDELLRHDLVDAVIVATPHQSLRDAAVTAILAGKHALVDKPAGVNEAEAADIERALVGTGVLCMPGYSLRFVEAHRRVHELIVAGAVGEVQAVTAGIGWQPLTDWRASPHTGGGALLYLGSHMVDAVLAVVRDEPQEVYADAAFSGDTGADETVGFQVRFREGAVAQCLATQATDEWFDYLNVYGREGHVGLSASYWLQYTLQVSSRTLGAYEQPTTICPRLTDDPIMLMLVPEVEEFGRAIAEDREPAVTMRDARRVLRVLDAALLSARTREPVQLESTSRRR